MFWANWWVFLKELSMSGSGIWWAHFDQICERNHQAFSKRNSWNSLMGSFKTYSQLTHWSHQDQSGEYIENLPTFYPLGKVWVNCLKTLNKLSMYPPGNTPSTPSESGIEISLRPCEGGIRTPPGHHQTTNHEREGGTTWLHRVALYSVHQNYHRTQGTVTTNFGGNTVVERHQFTNRMVAQPPYNVSQRVIYIGMTVEHVERLWRVPAILPPSYQQPASVPIPKTIMCRFDSCNRAGDFPMYLVERGELKFSYISDAPLI